MNSIQRARRDFRGKRLCDPCWDGKHSNKNYRNCEGGNCECECKAMGPDWDEHQRTVKRIAAELKESQTTFLDDVPLLKIERNS